MIFQIQLGNFRNKSGSFMLRSAPALMGQLPHIRGQLTNACTEAVSKYVLPVKTCEKTW